MKTETDRRKTMTDKEEQSCSFWQYEAPQLIAYRYYGEIQGAGDSWDDQDRCSVSGILEE
jgi:hypothetical protein